MNRKFIAAFAAVCIAAALLAALSVAYRVLAQDAAGKAAAKADFEGLRSVLSYVKSPSDMADPGLRARLASRYEANPSLLLVDVYEHGDGDRWRIPAESPYLSSVRSDGGLPQPIYPPASTILLSSSLKGDTSGKLAVDALYTSLPQLSVFLDFRDAMIGLAAFLALASLVLAIVSGSDMSRQSSTVETDTGALGEGAGSEAGADALASEEVAAAGAEYQYETLMEDSAQAPDDRPAARGISIKASAAIVDEDFDIPVIAESERPESAAAGSSARAGDAASLEGPSGLYSPASGLGWESYLKDRLDAELSRSASFEQDLSLLEVCYDGLTSQDANYETLGDTIRKFFSFRDLAFEKGDDGFAVILPNIDSTHAFRMAEEFYKKLVFLADGDFSELELLPIYMGISSRAGRLVDSGRIVEEADAAIEKARYEKDSRIVAFRPDPDKYRLFLASRGA